MRVQPHVRTNCDPCIAVGLGLIQCLVHFFQIFHKLLYVQFLEVDLHGNSHRDGIVVLPIPVRLARFVCVCATSGAFASSLDRLPPT